ncbi:hypothetical protein FIA58_018025 [Flavobacterium jejuense]|uniref:Glycerophosphoryl diester phosphodiesterase membrane domain-containing protein n=1 Tax=Flavobacterium jejuense TaxID=1544455 RepID=A0ABX0IXV5_9FLAO|nr:hypothetical protein [Flavobacterium jejuense]NHN27582.1 hypothetical protein [Flavobacterium jejuense]
MFQLYKKRGFSEFVGDTFEFLKLEGKNYFKNYFIINGPLLLILVVCIYFLMKVYMDAVFSTMATQNPNPNNILNNLMNNIPLFLSLGFVAFVLIILVSLINYSFPVSYLKLIGEKSEITTQSIFNLMKEKLGRTILFFLASLLVFLPIITIVMILLVLLMIIAIGFPLLIIIGPALISWLKLSYYDYITTENNYLKSVGNGFDLLKVKFWPIVGSTIIMYIIFYFVSSIFTMVPYFIGLATIFTDIQTNPDKTEAFSTISILASVVMVLSILSNYTLQNLIFLNQGIIFYSITDEKENISIKSDIDLIGSDSE